VKRVSMNPFTVTALFCVHAVLYGLTSSTLLTQSQKKKKKKKRKRIPLYCR